MKRTIVLFGLISGAISSAMMLATAPFAGAIGSRAEIVGYTTLVLSFMLVYFGVRAYRDRQGGGSIGFGRAMALGTLITVVSSLCYVITWEAAYFTFEHGFIDSYASMQLKMAQDAGATAAALDEKRRELASFKTLYDNPLYNAAITFTEPFPVGMVITLISAFALSRKRRPAAQ